MGKPFSDSVHGRDWGRSHQPENTGPNDTSQLGAVLLSVSNGTNGNDSLDGTPGNDTIDGRDGDDTINGLGGNDNLDGGRGNDLIDGGEGHDFINGWDGNDTLFGGEGNDTLRGVKNDDELHGGGGNDNLDGGSGNDTLFGGDGADVIAGVSGADSIDGGEGNDTIDAGSDSDTVDGGGGDDSINAGSGHDDVDGGSGNDSIEGGSGNDTMAGGTGNDTIIGGSGMDVAVFSGSIRDFVFSQSGSSVVVTDQNTADGDEGSDTVADDVEFLQFDDYTIDLTSQAANAPVIFAADQSTDEETSFSFTVDAIDFDGDPITLDNVTYTGAGSLTLVSTTTFGAAIGSGVTYTFNFDPDGMFEGLGVDETATETVTIQVSDGLGGVDSFSFDIVVNGVNDVPVANDDIATTDEDTAVIIDVLGNDTDVDVNDVLTVTSASALNGTVVINPDGTLTYTPDENYHGPDTITYAISDGNGGTDSASVSVTINPVNDAPDTAAPNMPAVTVNEADGIATIDLLGRTSDVDGDSLAIVSARFVDAETGERLGIQLILNPDGTVSFDPEDFGLGATNSLAVQIEYTVQDDSGAANDTSVGYVDVTINGSDVPPPPPNQAPVAGDLVFGIGDVYDEADGPITFDVGSVISDPDLDPLTIVAVFLDGGQELNFTVNGTEITVDPADFEVEDGVTEQVELIYVIDDGTGTANSSAQGTISFYLTGAPDGPPPDPTNNQPVANDVIAAANEVDGPYVIDLNGQVSDPDAGDTLTIASVSVLGGVLVDFTLEEGILTVDLASLGLNDDEVQTIEFEYIVEDDSGQSNNTATGTIELTVTGVTEDDPPGPDPQVVLDFEPFADPDDASIDITGINYQGLTFEGSAVVIETDEVASGGRDPNGIVLGQTTTDGQNVLVGTFSTIDIPLLDESGEPIIDEETGQVLTESVPDQLFSGYSSISTYRIEDDRVSLGRDFSGSPPPLPGPDPDDLGFSIGDSFSLDGLSLNIPSGVTNVTITTYTIVVIEEPVGTTGLSDYFYDYVVLDTFVFTVDGTDGAEILDFNAIGFADDFGNTNTAGFDDIYSFQITTDDGQAVVLDDILVTL